MHYKHEDTNTKYEANLNKSAQSFKPPKILEDIIRDSIHHHTNISEAYLHTPKVDKEYDHRSKDVEHRHPPNFRCILPEIVKFCGCKD